MKYASTTIIDEVEKIVVLMELSEVPEFDRNNPHPQTYGVDDEVQVGWVKSEDGTFAAPTTK